MELAGKRFVVIGGAGLIGSHAIESLLDEDPAEVVVYDNFVRGTHENLEVALADSRVRIFDLGGDIGHPDLLRSALDGADGAFHFAALWLLQCREFPRAAFEVNIAGTFNVLEACRDVGVERLVFSSSASVYGEAARLPMDEDHPFDNDTFYGASKIAGEQMARSFHQRYGLDYVGLRYFNVYGPRQDYQGAYIAVIMKMLDAIDEGRPIPVFGDGSQSYDFIYVGDCGRANVDAMRASTSDRMYNVCTGTSTSIKELADLVLDLTGSDVGISYEPAGETPVNHRIGDPTRARDEIGFEARSGLRDGLEQLIEWRAGHQAEVRARRAQAPG